MKNKAVSVIGRW